jgi:hypothetical protein
MPYSRSSSITWDGKRGRNRIIGQESHSRSRHSPYIPRVHLNLLRHYYKYDIYNEGTHNARLYHKVQYYLLHLIYDILLMWQHIYWRKMEKKQDSKSYLDSKSTIFEVINSFRLYDRVCITLKNDTTLVLLNGMPYLPEFPNFWHFVIKRCGILITIIHQHKSLQ